MTSWIDPMQERFDKTAASDAAFRRIMADNQFHNLSAELSAWDKGSDIDFAKFEHTIDDYPHDTQVEAADDFGRFAAACTMLAGLIVMGRFLLAPILRKIFG